MRIDDFGLIEDRIEAAPAGIVPVDERMSTLLGPYLADGVGDLSEWWNAR